MTTTTLCYIEQDGKYLMLHRVKKHNDINEGKWIGVGGHAENQETPEECLVREVKEETGLTLTSYRFRGLVTFISNECEPELMCVFTADGFTGAGNITINKLFMCHQMLAFSVMIMLKVWIVIFIRQMMVVKHLQR